MWRRASLLFLALLMFLTLTACGKKEQTVEQTSAPASASGATSTPKPSPTLTPTPRPTNAPTPKPTLMPTPKPTARADSTPEPTSTPSHTEPPSPFMPKINKQPSGEGHFAGESAVFVTYAENWTSLHWTAVSPSGREVDLKTFRETFPDSTVVGDTESTLTITNLNIDMSGWSFYCTFENNGVTATTNSARLKVTSRDTGNGSGSGSGSGSKTKTLRCSNCGEEVDREDIICPHCGKNVYSDDAIIVVDEDGNISYLHPTGAMYFEKGSRVSSYVDTNSNYTVFNDSGLISSGNYKKEEEAAAEQARQDELLTALGY